MSISGEAMTALNAMRRADFRTASRAVQNALDENPPHAVRRRLETAHSSLTMLASGGGEHDLLDVHEALEPLTKRSD
ncbi:MAG: hypothetical protein F4Y02_09110 [Chloroflexi bacterium]|nr:hypothetical protein [Chloroflexota bacterium]